jgi:hypothetical protein
MDSNSIGGIRVHFPEGGREMLRIKPKRKQSKGEQLTQPLEGELAAYEQIGLFQHAVTNRTAYRYRGVLLQYQRALKGATPTLDTSTQFLALLRK